MTLKGWTRARPMWSCGMGGVRGEHVFPRRQGVAAALLAAVPQHPGHDREEGGPQRAPLAADLAAAHRVAARACEARARALEGGRRAAAAAAPAAGVVHEGAAL